MNKHDDVVSFIGDSLEALELTETDKRMGGSTHYGCEFWQTKHDQVFLTNYNVFNSKRRLNYLKKENSLVLFCQRTRRFKTINGQTIYKIEYMKEIIGKFARG